jgi:arylesterase / paraoxonase
MEYSHGTLQYTPLGFVALNSSSTQGTFINPDHSTGSIYSYDYTSDSKSPRPMQLVNFSQSVSFHPLGISFHAATKTLYVVNHAETGSCIEVFLVNINSNTLVHKQTIRHPHLPTPNSITPLSDHEVLVTNDHKWIIRRQPALAHFETFAAYPGGTVVYVNIATNKTRKLAALPFANGIAQLSGNRVAVSSTTLPAVFIYAMDPTTRAFTLLKKLRTPFWPDNLNVDSAGTLLIAGHPWAIGLTPVAKENYKYDVEGKAGEGLLPFEDRPRAASWVAEWDGNEEGQLRTLYVGTEFGTSTAADRDLKRGVGIVVGLYERGVMVWKE